MTIKKSKKQKIKQAAFSIILNEQSIFEVGSEKDDILNKQSEKYGRNLKR